MTSGPALAAIGNVAAPSQVADRRVRVLGPLLGGTLIVVVVAALAAFFPPLHHHYAGGDAADYVNNAFQRSYEHRSGAWFTPAQWPDLDPALVGRAFTDGRYLPSDDGRQGLMTNFVRVFDGEVHIAHDDLTAMVMGEALELGVGQRAIAYVNYAALAAAAVAILVLCRNLGLARVAALIAALALVLIPSHVEGARYPLSEAIAQALWLSFVAFVVGTRARSPWPLLLLPLLVVARPEFAVVATIAGAWVGFRRWFHPVVVVALAASAWLSPTIGALGPFGGPLAIPSAVVAGLALRVVVDAVQHRAPPMWPGTGRVPARVRRWLPTTALILGAIGIVAAELVRRQLDPGTSFGPLHHQRYSTLGLLRDAVGWPLLVVGVVGLIWRARELADRCPALVYLLVLPQLAVFASMHASPATIHFWTRRFHLVVFPVLVVGVAAAVSALLERRRRWAGMGLALAAVVLISVASPLRDLDSDAWSWRYLNDFHGDLTRLPSESVVLLPNNSPGLKAQLPMRTVHGLYSFVVYDDDTTSEVLSKVDGGDPPVFAEVATARRLGLAVSGPAVAVRVRVSRAEGTTLELRQVCPADGAVPGCSKG